MSEVETSEVVASAPEMTEEQLNAAATEVTMEIGRRVYHGWLIEKEVEALRSRLFELNMKAYQMKNATKAAEAAVEA